MFREIRPVGNSIDSSFEAPRADRFAPYAVQYFDSGTAALAQALIQARQQHPSKSPKVLMPGYACPDLISAAQFAGVRPVLIDFAAGLPFISLEQVAQYMDADCCALVAIDFLGIAERTDKLLALCHAHHCLLIEDSAQSLPTGGFEEYWRGDLVVISFGRGKPLGMLSGGALLSQTRSPVETDDKRSAKASLLAKLKTKAKITLYNWLIKPSIYHWISRIRWLKLGQTHYHPLEQIEPMSPGWRELINANFKRYQKLPRPQDDYQTFFSQLNSPAVVDLASRCGHPADIPLLRFPLLITDKTVLQRLMQAADSKGLGVSLFYQKALPKISGVQVDWFDCPAALDEAERFAAQLVTLPNHAGVKPKDRQAIFNAIKYALGSS